MAKKTTSRKSVPVAFYNALLQSVLGNYKALVVRAGGDTAKKIAALSSEDQEGGSMSTGSDEWIVEVTKLLYAHSRETLRLMTVTTVPLTSPEALPELFTFLGLSKKVAAASEDDSNGS